ncbi:MAG: 4-hydroxy-3-methylbut-2-enyl diphosphate reductase [Candidatus Eisenbacteria bacterium]|nr:4-hydroxy-3-methylbut-2-enyl diphosphate reductase [Candidatus Eisenbacteria bacterium]
MRVTVAPGSGFCFGVKRAIRLAERALEESKGPFYTLGELIHNPQVVGELENRGLRVANAISEIERGTVVIRCHGVSPGIIEEASKKKLRVVDATCPFVKKAQELASFLSGAGYWIVVVGDRGHPEVEAIAGGLRKVSVVGTEAEALRLKKAKKLGVVAQTTQSFDTLSNIVSILVGKTQELRVHNTTCETTSRRQAEALKLAGKVDVMVVVGGRKSANTARLYDICRKRVRRTLWVETAGELKRSWFRGAVHVGVTGGASTPDWLIREVADRIASIGAHGKRVPVRAQLPEKNY